MAIKCTVKFILKYTVKCSIYPSTHSHFFIENEDYYGILPLVIKLRSITYGDTDSADTFAIQVLQVRFREHHKRGRGMTETIRKSVSWLCKLSARNTRQMNQ